MSIVLFCFCDDQVNSYLFKRLVVSNGHIQGDNRVDALTLNYFDLWKTGDLITILFGLSDYTETGASSWKQIFARSGIVGFIVLSLIMILNIFGIRKVSYWNLHFIAFTSVFILSIYQRPNILFPYYMIIFYSGIMNSDPVIRIHNFLRHFIRRSL